MRISDWSSDVCSSDLFVIAYDHGKLRTACIGPLHAFLHIAAKAHVAGDSCTAEVREQACRRFFGRRAHGDQDNMGFFFLWGINKHREPLDPRRPANARRFRPAERFDKAVIAPPRQHGPLRAQAVGSTPKSRVAIVSQAAQIGRAKSRERVWEYV